MNGGIGSRGRFASTTVVTTQLVAASAMKTLLWTRAITRSVTGKPLDSSCQVRDSLIGPVDTLGTEPFERSGGYGLHTRKSTRNLPVPNRNRSGVFDSTNSAIPESFVEFTMKLHEY